MEKSGKGKALVVILVAVVMVGAGVFFAYKKGYIGKNDKLNEENNNIENSNIEISKNDSNKKEDESKSTTSITNAELMDLYQKQTEGQESYAVSDLNGDGTLDLITYKEENASDKVVSNYTVYSYVDGKVTELGKILGRKDNNLLYKMSDNTILSVYGYMGHEVVKTYAIENNKLVEKSSKDRDVKTGETYTTGDEYIPFDFISDTIQFEMNK